MTFFDRLYNPFLFLNMEDTDVLLCGWLLRVWISNCSYLCWCARACHLLERVEWGGSCGDLHGGRRASRGGSPRCCARERSGRACR